MVQRAHVVQAVGELDQQDAHVVGDGEQQLAKVLGLLGLLRHEVEFLDLGEAFDQPADVGAEEFVDLGAASRSVSSIVSCSSATAMVDSSSGDR
jgi:hypothetical protein